MYNEQGVLIFSGDFVKGKRRGIGVEYRPETGEKIYQGQWNNDLWNGYGKVFNEYGELEYEGRCRNGEPYKRVLEREERNKNRRNMERDLLQSDIRETREMILRERSKSMSKSRPKKSKKAAGKATKKDDNRLENYGVINERSQESAEVNVDKEIK